MSNKANTNKDGSQRSATIDYYNQNASTYIDKTIDISMDSLYTPFLRYVPKGGMILDAGCGSGRDSKAFINRGYEVVSIDASKAMVEATSELTQKKPFMFLSKKSLMRESLMVFGHVRQFSMFL